MKIAFSKPGVPETGVVVVTVRDGASLGPLGDQLDATTEGGLTRAMKLAKFKGKPRQTLFMPVPANTRLEGILLIGTGKEDKMAATTAQDLGGSIYASLSGRNPRTVSVLVDENDDRGIRVWEMAAQIAYGAQLKSYRFDKYRTKQEEADIPSIGQFKLLTPSGGRAKGLYDSLSKVADGVFFTRDLVSEPANVLYPESFAERCQELRELGLEIEVIGEAELRKIGMGALLGVGQGSARESKVVIMHWKGAKGRGRKAQAPICFVGKGVTFDTGGISLKPAGGMEDMKWDMGGAGTVAGLMKALAGREAKVNAIGIVGLVENMPSGEAQRPGDVVTSLSGQTIEVINTDAEGRLVLCDVLTYVQDRYEPKTIIDLATLTGAIIISLGHERAGVFTNSDTLADQLSAAGDATNDLVWRLPLGDAYDSQLKSSIADMMNVGGRAAGSITAAQFLKRFINDGVNWAHIDIAGMAWGKKDRPTSPRGGTGFGVRLLDRLVADYYESR